MKVLFLSRLFYPHVGGIELHIEKLSAQLIKNNIEVTVLTTAHESNLATQETWNNINIIRIPYNIEPNKKQLWKWIIDHNNLFQSFDIIHAHDVVWWLWPLLLIGQVTVYTTFHGYEGRNPPKLSQKIHRKLAEIVSQKSICVGAFMKKWYWAHPNIVTYGATDIVFEKAKNFNKNSAIFLGRLNHDTGILEYLEILIQLKKDNINITLDIFGDGPLLKQAQKIVQKNDLNVTFNGFIPHAYKKIADYEWAFVSRYLAILEAMKAKRKIVAHYNNQIKHDYLRCHPQADLMHIFNDPEVASQYILQNDDQLNLEEAYQWASKQTWNHLSNQYIQLWKS